jgi:hypothetical protein
MFFISLRGKRKIGDYVARLVSQKNEIKTSEKHKILSRNFLEESK